ncbi:hypothetical protein ACFSO7_13905 [Bacillus sp. CGMCC 1.16607]
MQLAGHEFHELSELTMSCYKPSPAPQADIQAVGNIYPIVNQ